MLYIDDAMCNRSPSVAKRDPPNEHQVRQCCLSRDSLNACVARSAGQRVHQAAPVVVAHCHIQGRTGRRYPPMVSWTTCPAASHRHYLCFHSYYCGYQDMALFLLEAHFARMSLFLRIGYPRPKLHSAQGYLTSPTALPLVSPALLSLIPHLVEVMRSCLGALLAQGYSDSSQLFGLVMACPGPVVLV
jgi:hypothetical protein